ncbi:unnamed protein product [Phyllotreta striolata]|uniref:DDB1- and CUL4-associated factor 15 WD40 repeat-containing domain-containing protein n=1 Tax=Phyllotreta striolata TaxID=444603 RepID=A0A9N9XP95_PHYSR|nr:unnamed protein product [Phyllotreta striolata]
MAYVLSDNDFSDSSQFSVNWEEHYNDKNDKADIPIPQYQKTTNLAQNILNRQLFGRFAKNPRAKTERVFNTIHANCKFDLYSLIENVDSLNHIYMGFTMCGRYFVSYTEKISEDPGSMSFTSSEYELYLWRFCPGKRLRFISKHKIFKHLKDFNILNKVKFMQFPGDLYKLVCYCLSTNNPDLIYVTILTLPAPENNCRHCNNIFSNTDESVNQGWCNKHGFIVHFLFSMAQPTPVFDPSISLAYPNHLVINTGHHIHILNVTTSEPPQIPISLLNLSKDDDTMIKVANNTPTHTFNDTLSELSESASEHFGSSSLVDAILEDFSEYDLESNECNKPFHELNISCEPLNVTGKSYHNTLVQNIVDPRVKRLQGNSKDYLFSVPQCSSAQKTLEKTKIAEKAYEFIEENEKYEKISSFRKKRLAEKKYEFSEDNSENIVPFNSLRRDRRYLYKSQGRCIRSPDFNSIFLSPRSSSIRSPAQSPKSRNGQFSPSGARNLYCPSLRNSPHHSKSPISPRESARKFYVYSPSLDSDCSDSDSRLIMRTAWGAGSGERNTGLLIVDPKSEAPKWIKRIVRRYSNGDFENGSLVSGQSRDDFNIPIEIPLLVQNLIEQQLDVIPDFKADQTAETQLLVTQRSFDCEMFVQRTAQKLCAEVQLDFVYCEDYDIRILYICPINGHIICHVLIKLGARKGSDMRLEHYKTNFLFTWSIDNDAFNVIDNKPCKLLPIDVPLDYPEFDIPKSSEVLDMDYTSTSKRVLRDYDKYFEICLELSNSSDQIFDQEYSSESD